MVVLFILFIIQFAIACACLAVDSETQVRKNNHNFDSFVLISMENFYLSQKALAEAGWKSADNETHGDVQKAFHCCGFQNQTEDSACHVS